MSKNTLNQNSRLIVADLPYVNFKANWFKFFVQSSEYNILENPFLSAFKGLAPKIFYYLNSLSTTTTKTYQDHVMLIIA